MSRNHLGSVLPVLATLVLVIAACGGDDAGETATDRGEGALALVVDSDMGVEGSMSILYLLSHPDVEVRAITVSGTGLVSCDRGVEQALGLIALAGADDIPVACGPTEPLEGDNAFPSEFTASVDDLYGVSLPDGGEPSDMSAPELLAAVVEDSDVPVAIYADGPLTNVALALEAISNPDDAISGVTFMGGAVEAAGNTLENFDAEWNVWVDPVAADRVLSSGVPVTMVPLDATNLVPLTSKHVSAIEEHTATPMAETIGQLVAASYRQSQGNPLYFWDQLVATVVTDPEVATLEDRPISVVTTGGPGTIGRTQVADDASVVSVALDADRDLFEQTYFSTVFGELFQPIQLSVDIRVTFDGEWTHEAPSQMPLGTTVLEFENSSGQPANAIVLWLIGDATVEDLDEWGSIEQPPFVELAGFAFAEPGTTRSAVIELTHAGDNILHGLTIAPDSAKRLATIEVG